MLPPALVDEALLQSAMVLVFVCHRVPLRFTPCFYEMLRWSKCAPAMTPEGKYLEAQQRGSANVYFFDAEYQTVNLPGYGTIFKIDNCGEGFLMRGVCELINGVETALKVFFYPLNNYMYILINHLVKNYLYFLQMQFFVLIQIIHFFYVLILTRNFESFLYILLKILSYLIFQT